MNMYEDSSLALANKLADLHLSDSGSLTSSDVRYEPHSNHPDTLCLCIEQGWMLCKFDDHTSTPENLNAFTSRYPPSQITIDQCQWIAVDRRDMKSHPRPPKLVEKMQAAFKILADSHRRDGNITLTVSSLDQLARAHNVTSGKWLIFADQNHVDALWTKVAQLVCMHRKKGSAKVSPNKGDYSHVICVYVDDFSDMEDVMGLRQDLRNIGVTYKIKFKMDAYTHLEIYGNNSWGIRPSRYFE